MKKETSNFNIEHIIKKLPLNFRYLTTEDISDVSKNSSRIEIFESYNSTQSSCHKFSKPISKLS